MPKTKSGIRSKTAHRTLEQMRKHGRTYQASATQKKRRAQRNNARARLMREGKVRKGDGKHVDHKTSLSKGGSNNRSNLRAVTRRRNLTKNNRS
jgi:5-methylcytosine-specific restriction endonuclease McrA